MEELQELLRSNSPVSNEWFSHLTPWEQDELKEVAHYMETLKEKRRRTTPPSRFLTKAGQRTPRLCDRGTIIILFLLTVRPN